jgi:hypothetical protein
LRTPSRIPLHFIRATRTPRARGTVEGPLNVPYLLTAAGRLKSVACETNIRNSDPQRVTGLSSLRRQGPSVVAWFTAMMKRIWQPDGHRDFAGSLIPLLPRP